MYKNREESYFCRFTFGQFFTLLVLEIFTLFFIFYLGARYGPEFLRLESKPVASQAKSPELIATTQDPEIQALAKDLIENSPTPDLKKRVANLLEKEVSEPSDGSAGDGSASKGTVAKEIEGAGTVTHILKRYAIQVGAYPEVWRANQAVAHWKDKGYSAYLTTADLGKRGLWHRVRIGGFETKEQAQAYLASFKVNEKVDAVVVENPP